MLKKTQTALGAIAFFLAAHCFASNAASHSLARPSSLPPFAGMAEPQQRVDERTQLARALATRDTGSINKTSRTPSPGEPRSGEGAPLMQPLLQQLLSQQLAQAKEQARASQALQDKVDALRPNFADKAVTGLIALFSALIGALSAFALQRQRLKYEERSARRSVGIKELSEIKQFRSRQLNEFYAPLETSLKQGLVVRNELYARLLATNDSSLKFGKVKDGRAAVGWSLTVARPQKKPEPFRLLLDLNDIAQKFPDVMSTVGELMRINAQVVKLIHRKVGLVKHANTQLNELLGTYLAHQSVLNDVYKAIIDGKPMAALTYTTTFPRGLQQLVTEDCNELRNELKQWEDQVSQWSLEMTLGKSKT